MSLMSVAGCVTAAQREKAAQFVRLHQPGSPLVLYNAWDAGSARVVAEAGACAIATGSQAVASAHGLGDGQLLPLALVIANLQRILAAVSLPVTLDFEAGYARDAHDVARNVREVIACGAVGINLEDVLIGEARLFAVEAQVARIAAVRRLADDAHLAFFINARTDLFLFARRADHDAALLEATLERAKAYHDAGARGLFVPGLVDEGLLATLCARSPLPVNAMIMPGCPPVPRLRELGVARVSFGGTPYRLAMEALQAGAEAAFNV
jgi:2-methylisocitrate lyase-like PEP mutase family enzyme